jgi:hypothetical protein
MAKAEVVARENAKAVKRMVFILVSSDKLIMKALAKKSLEVYKTVIFTAKRF